MVPDRPREQVFDLTQIEEPLLFRPLNQAIERLRFQASRKVEQQPRHRRHRDLFDQPPIRIFQPPRPMNVHRQPRPPCHRSSHMERPGTPPRQAPKPRRRVMAKHSSRPTGKDRGQTLPVRREIRMPHRINTAIDVMKAPSCRCLLKRALRVPEHMQLTNRDHAMLPMRQIGQWVWSSFGLHKRPKLNHTLSLPPRSLLFVP